MNHTETSPNDGTIVSTPRPFSEIPKIWLKVTQMSEDFFFREAPRASSSNTLISVAIFAAATALIPALNNLAAGAIQLISLTSEFGGVDVAGFFAVLAASVLPGLCINVILTPISFYLGNGLSYLGARVFGGSGDFSTQLYLQSLFAVPLGIIASLLAFLSLVPLVGYPLFLLVALVILAYGVVLNVRVFKVVHDFSTGRAIGAIVAPFLVLLIIPCIVILVLALLGPAIGDVFGNIIENI